MAQVINTNIMSLNAQRNLNTTTASLASSVQRLSSGLRINSAKDDAAGLAISERFTTQIRGLEVAARNANDGISLAQTAEGALAEIGNNLQRIRELAVQSRNATNSDSDRKALDAEVQQLKAEIQRVAEHTEFNGTKLLNGSFSQASFQIGANQGQTITVDGITNADISKLGGKWNTVGGQMQAVSAAVTIAEADAAKAISVKVNGVEVKVAAAETGKRSETEALELLHKAFTDAKVDGVTFSSDHKFISDADIKIELPTALGGITAGDVKVTKQKSAEVEGFATQSVLTAADSDNMIRAMDAALNAVNSTRAELGAIQNRFTSVVANLNSTSENLSASRSRIRDTDYARETSELTRTQILQQAGTAMLAQAKSMPQSVLSLLQ